MSKLLVVHDGKRERELLLVERLVVGRDPMCDFSHDDSLLSRRHAEFATVGDEVTVRDLGSRNGLFVNGARTAERALRPGDIVTIGPLRVRYVTSSAPFSLAPDELDSGSTRVIAATLPRSATLPKPVPAVTTPMAPASPAPTRAGDAEDFEDDEEEVTRVVQASDLSVGTDAEPADDLDDAQATMMVSASSLAPETPVPAASPARIPAPASRAAATLLIAAPPAAPSAAPDMIMREPSPARAPQPAAAPPVAAEPVVINASSLTGFVFVLLAALASVVFVASAAPLIMWRGDEAQAPSLANLLRWPVLPIIIAMATTYVVATLVNRRFVDMLMALQQDTDSGQDASPGGYPRG